MKYGEWHVILCDYVLCNISHFCWHRIGRELISWRTKFFLTQKHRCQWIFLGGRPWTCFYSWVVIPPRANQWSDLIWRYLEVFCAFSIAPSYFASFYSFDTLTVISPFEFILSHLTYLTTFRPPVWCLGKVL